MAEYTSAAMANMHPMFGRAYSNEHETCGMCYEQFPHCGIPDQKTSATERWLEENGTSDMLPNNHGCTQTVLTAQQEVKILDCIPVNPETSTRTSTKQEFHRTQCDLHIHLPYPYHLQQVQNFGKRLLCW